VARFAETLGARVAGGAKRVLMLCGDFMEVSFVGGVGRSLGLWRDGVSDWVRHTRMCTSGGCSCSAETSWRGVGRLPRYWRGQ
jgi:hypothetical protein